MTIFVVYVDADYPYATYISLCKKDAQKYCDNLKTKFPKWIQEYVLNKEKGVKLGE